jgi:hypothetical protein
MDYLKWKTLSPRNNHAKATLLLDEPGAKLTPLPHSARFKKLINAD